MEYIYLEGQDSTSFVAPSKKKLKSSK
jgi:hypothetical protein